MDEKCSIAKWEGKLSTILTKAGAKQIWSFFIDFFNFHKWFPLPTCYGIEGVNGEVGGIHYCSGFSLPHDDTSLDKVNWAKERLVAVDTSEMCLSYDIVDCNIGFKSYLATFKIVPSGDEGCIVEWSFSVDPVEGLTYKKWVEMYRGAFDHMTRKMEDDVVQMKTS